MQFVLLVVDENFLPDFVDQIAVFLYFGLEVCKESGVLFENIEHLDLELGELLFQSVKFFVFLFLLLQFGYFLLIYKHSLAESHYLTSHLIHHLAIFANMQVLIHPRQTGLFDTASYESRLHLFSIFVCK